VGKTYSLGGVVRLLSSSIARGKEQTRRRGCLCSGSGREQFDEEKVVGGVEFGADIAFGGARESSRQSGRNAEKAAAKPIRVGPSFPLRLTAKRAFPGNA
jgi:hypothetical protein